MRGNWWKIAKLELTLAMKDRESLIWSLAAPIAMAWLFGTMFGSDAPPDPTHVKVEPGTYNAGMEELAGHYLEWRGFKVADDGIVVVLPASMLKRISSGSALTVHVIQGKADAMQAQSVSAAM